jgi:hypothetical protein
VITNITADSPPTVTVNRRTKRPAATRAVLVVRQLEDDELDRWLSDCASLLAQHLGGRA